MVPDAVNTEERQMKILVMGTAGIAAAKARGARWGGSKAGRLWKVTGEKAEVVREMKASGKSIATIARCVGLSRGSYYLQAAPPNTAKDDNHHVGSHMADKRTQHGTTVVRRVQGGGAAIL